MPLGWSGRRWRLTLGAIAVSVLGLGPALGGARATLARASARGAVPKLIWGPVALPNGNSAFPIYHQLGVDVFQVDLNWADTAPSRPANPDDPADPAYRWPAQLDQAISEARRYGIKLCLLVQGTPRLGQRRPRQRLGTDQRRGLWRLPDGRGAPLSLGASLDDLG